MPETAGSSITDMLINQPVLVWSLAGGLGILVIAGLLSVFLALRSRFRKGKAAKQALQEQRKSEAKANTAVADKNAAAEAKASKKASAPDPKSATEKTTSGGETAVADQPIADDQKGFLLIGENTESFELEDATLDEFPEVVESEATVEEQPQEENGLAALFSADTIVDPYVQALRDHLPAITIDELLTNIRSVSHELQEQINANS
ncbi:MAG: hypothetical protein H6657_23940 [Ardenticatenaceae bacterium]|nr:hypothetical protein [Ardenticatenaceae bacterium]